jgi:hypothetical protein
MRLDDWNNKGNNLSVKEKSLGVIWRYYNKRDASRWRRI